MSIITNRTPTKGWALINNECIISIPFLKPNKKTFPMYKKEKINVIFNAPYQSEFNPIEMVFSLLRKKLNKKIVKNKTEITEVINNFIKETKESTLTNIFNHSKNTLKNFLKI